MLMLGFWGLLDGDSCSGVFVVLLVLIGVGVLWTC